MTQLHRPLVRSLLISASALALFVAGCNKKPPVAAPPAYTPPPAAVKPTATLSADRTSINKGESVKSDLDHHRRHQRFHRSRSRRRHSAGLHHRHALSLPPPTRSPPAVRGRQCRCHRAALASPRLLLSPKLPNSASTNSSSRKCATRTSITTTPRFVPMLARPPENRRLPQELSQHPRHHRRPLRRTRLHRIQPGSRPAPRQCRQAISRQPGHSRRPSHHHQLGQRKALLHRIHRSLLRAKSSRPLRPKQAVSSAGISPKPHPPQGAALFGVRRPIRPLQLSLELPLPMPSSAVYLSFETASLRSGLIRHKAASSPCASTPSPEPAAFTS